jgi:hypothetical protein
MTVSMYVENKFIIAGKFYDEEKNENIGILNIRKADDEIFFEKTISKIENFHRKRSNSHQGIHFKSAGDTIE